MSCPVAKHNGKRVVNETNNYSDIIRLGCQWLDNDVGEPINGGDALRAHTLFITRTLTCCARAGGQLSGNLVLMVLIVAAELSCSL